MRRRDEEGSLLLVGLDVVVDCHEHAVGQQAGEDTLPVFGELANQVGIVAQEDADCVDDDL